MFQMYCVYIQENNHNFQYWARNIARKVYIWNMKFEGVQ